MKNKIPLFCILIGSLGIADSLFVVLLSNFNLGTAFPGLLGFVLLLYGLFYEKWNLWEKNSNLGKLFMRTAKIGFFVWLISFVSVMLLLIQNAAHSPTKNADAVIVLGAGLHGDKVTETLALRLDKAMEYYHDNDSPLIVVSGGQGPQETVTEAFAMKKYLVEHGIPENDIMMEDASHNTRQNFENSKKILDDVFKNSSYKIVYVTNQFHTFRAGLLAKKAGFDADGFGAKDYTYLIPNLYSREYFSIIKYVLVDSW